MVYDAHSRAACIGYVVSPLGMDLSELSAISPVDGRYGGISTPLREYLSEYGLIRYRTLVEVRWLQHLSAEPGMEELPPLPSVVNDVLNRVVDDFAVADAQAIKKIEAQTNHDVKAVEYFVRDKLGDSPELERMKAFVHFACTSEDINNLAYALAIAHVRDRVLLPLLTDLSAQLKSVAQTEAEHPMLSRTHGQSASPTTLGKEIANVRARLNRQQAQLAELQILGKANGAVGNYNAHQVAYPELDWPDIGGRFVESLGLTCNAYTTQIEPHDWLAEYCDVLGRIDTILIDFCRDVWGYISLGYFNLRLIEGEVGSSTMPHKVNPIDFENAEGNLGVSRSMLRHLASKLPISRWQRDLSDSTVMRNTGVAIAHSLIGWQALQRGLHKIEPNPEQLAADLAANWAVLAEPIQTVMRRYGMSDAYEQIKKLTRGRKVDREAIHKLIESLDLPAEAKQQLLALRPDSYLGFAAELTKKQ